MPMTFLAPLLSPRRRALCLTLGAACLFAGLAGGQVRAEEGPGSGQRVAAATVARARELAAQLASETYEAR